MNRMDAVRPGGSVMHLGSGSTAGLIVEWTGWMEYDCEDR